MDVRLDHVRAAVQGLGLPAGPAALHPPDRGRHTRHRSGRGELRRDHLRQGRVRAQAAGGLRRAGELPRRRAQVLRRARLGQRDPGRPAGRPGGDLGPRPGLVGGGVAADRRGEHAAAVVHAGRRRRIRRVRGGAGGARHPSGAPLAPHRHRAVRPDRRRPGPPAPGGDRRGRAAHGGARAGRAAATGPGPGQRRGPHLRQDPAGRAFAAHAGGVDRRIQGLAARRAVLVRRLGHVPGRGDGGPRLRPARDAGHFLGGRHQRGADPAAAGRPGGPPVRRPRLAGDRADPDGRRAAQPAVRGLARLRRPAGLRPGLHRGGRGRRRPGPAGRAARRLGGARRPDRRHRAALGAAGTAGEPRLPRLRPGRDQRGAGPGRHRRGRAACGGVPRGHPHRRGQAGRLGPARLG